MNDKKSEKPEKPEKPANPEKMQDLLYHLTALYESWVTERMELVKQYRDSFKQAFEKNNSKALLDLIDIKQINKQPINSKLEQIKELQELIKKSKPSQNKTQEIEKQIKNIKSKIQEIKQEVFKYEKLNKKLNQNKDLIKQDIKKEFKEINIEVN